MFKKISSSQSAPTDNKTFIWFCLILVFSLTLFFFRLGERPLRNPDEGRYAAIAKEMFVSGDWGVPTLFGLAYLKKPILFYWLTAGSFQFLGVNEWAARAVPAFFGVLGVFLIFIFCLKYFGRKTAVTGSLMLASNFWYLQTGRYLVIDMVFSFFLIAAALSFYVAHSSVSKNTKRVHGLFFVFLACAVLTKGPVAIAVSGSSILAYLVLTKQLGRALSEINWAVGSLLFGLITLPWFIWIGQKEPFFIKLFFGHENWNRVFSSGFEHQEGWYFYFVLIIPMLMPWILFPKPFKRALQAVAQENRTGGPLLFLTVCGVVTILFFSLAKAKLPTYILPSVVFLLIPLTRGWELWLGEADTKGSWFDFFPIILLMLAGIGLIVVSPWYVLERSAGKYPAQIASDLQFLGGILLAGGVFGMRSLRQNRRAKLMYSLVAVWSLISIIFPNIMEAMNPNYSTKAFAKELSPVIRPSEDVYIYDQPGAFYDFGFYLDHPVKLVGLEGEMEFSRMDKKVSGVSVTRDRFRDMLAANEKFYCLIRKSDFSDLPTDIQSRLHILREDKRKVLFRSGAQEGAAL